MNSEYDIEIQKNINENGLAESVKIHKETENIIEDIESLFPMSFSGIDWDQCDILFEGKFGFDMTNYLKGVKEFLKKIVDSFPCLLNETVIVLGDGLTELAFEMKFDIFLTLHESFLSLPQHTYIWFSESKKCINFTFENEAFFG